MPRRRHSRASNDQPRCSRRGFLQGVAASAGAALLPAGVAGCGTDPGAAAAGAQDLPAYYPPALQGLRGSHPGSFESAHALRDGRALPNAASTGEAYDLVVVGGGISGLAAAFLYRERRPAATVLVLENHDDFGGHAKRNEFRLDGELQLLNGGTLSIQSPRPYSAVADALLRRLGIDAPALANRIQQTGYYASLGLVNGYFFDQPTFGGDRLVRRDPGARWSQTLADAPLSLRARDDIVRLEESTADYLTGLSVVDKQARLGRISYRDFLRDHVRIGPEAVAFYQQRTHDIWGVGIDAVPALDAWGYPELPGFAGLALPRTATPLMGTSAAGYLETGGSVDLHFPDGGATIARALVRALAPEALAVPDLDALVSARADYAALDRAGSATRIRLGATVVKVANLGAGDEGVRVNYMRAGRGHAVLGRHCVLACWNAVIPYLCPELPAAQRAALRAATKIPLIYTSVAIRNWQSLARLGVANIHAPGGYFSDMSLNEAVAIGRYATPRTPDQPTLLRLLRVPCAPGLPEHEQNRLGRTEILATSLERFEAEVRRQLGRMLGPGGFDPARDILGITVNRWPHGYAHEFNPLFDRLLPEAEQPHVLGRARRGAIVIANSDAGASSYMDAAIDQAARAVEELLDA